MSTKVIRFPKFSTPHQRDEKADPQAQWHEITDRLNKFKAQLEQEFANVYAAIPVPTAAGATNPFNSTPASGTANPAGGGGGPSPPSPGTLIPYEVPAGVIDGVNTVFTVSRPVLNNQLFLILNTTFQEPGANYVLGGSTITYATPPVIGDKHFSWYWTP